MLVRQITNQAFKAAIGKLLTQEMPLKTTIILKGVVDILNNQIDAFEKVRQELLAKYAISVDGVLQMNDDRTAKFTDDGFKSYAEEYNSLTNVDVPVPTLTLAELGDKINISYEDLMTLNGLILY